MQVVRAGLFELAYVERGHGPAVLWLHGGFVSHEAWAPQRDHFDGSAWRHIYVDLPGHGRSNRAASAYDVEVFASALLTMLENLNVSRAALVGHSLGGMIAQSMARQAPDRVACLVLADTTYSTTSTLLEQAQTALAAVSFKLLGIERIARASARQLSKNREDLKPFICAQMMQHADDLTAYRAMWDAVFRFDSRPWLSQLNLPVLLLLAEQNHATQRQVPGFLAALPHARAEQIPRAGHMLGWDNPEAFNAAVERFLREFL